MPLWRLQLRVAFWSMVGGAAGLDALLGFYLAIFRGNPLAAHRVCGFSECDSLFPVLPIALLTTGAGTLFFPREQAANSVALGIERLAGNTGFH